MNERSDSKSWLNMRLKRRWKTSTWVGFQRKRLDLQGSELRAEATSDSKGPSALTSEPPPQVTLGQHNELLDRPRPRRRFNKLQNRSEKCELISAGFISNSNHHLLGHHAINRKNRGRRNMGESAKPNAGDGMIPERRKHVESNPGYKVLCERASKPFSGFPLLTQAHTGAILPYKATLTHHRHSCAGGRE